MITRFCAICHKELKGKDKNFIPIPDKWEEDCFFCKQCIPKLELQMEKGRSGAKSFIILFLALAISVVISPILFIIVLIVGIYYLYKQDYS